MKQFYTKKISDKVCQALHEVNFPFPIADMGFTVPQIVEMPVDYASVLDWLIEQGVFLSIYKQNEEFYDINIEGRSYNELESSDFLDVLDSAIILSVYFLKEEKQQMKTYDEFVQDVWSLVEDCPKSWRKGQSVFNVIDDTYGVARMVQFDDHVDCFYDDTKIDEFMQKAYEKLKDINR